MVTSGGAEDRDFKPRKLPLKCRLPVQNPPDPPPKCRLVPWLVSHMSSSH